MVMFKMLVLVPWPCPHPAASDHRSLHPPRLSSVSPTILPVSPLPPLPPRRVVVDTESGSATSTRMFTKGYVDLEAIYIYMYIYIY